MFSDDLRQRARDRFHQLRPDRPSDRATYLALAQELGVGVETVRRWVKAEANLPRRPAMPLERVDGHLSVESARHVLDVAGQNIIHTTGQYIDGMRQAIDSSTFADTTVTELRDAFTAITGSRDSGPTTDIDSLMLTLQASAEIATTRRHAAFLDEMLTHMIFVAHRAGIAVSTIAASAGLTEGQVRHRIKKRNEELDEHKRD
jgi:hypothetical protein